LQPLTSFDFTVRLFANSSAVFQNTILTADFRVTSDVTILIEPQIHAFDDSYMRAAVDDLRHFARMFPVRDGAGRLDADDSGGFDSNEVAHCTGADAGRRFDNWNAFIANNAEAARQTWNREHTAGQLAQHVLNALTTGNASGGSPGQNFTGLGGQGGSRNTYSWSTVYPPPSCNVPILIQE